FRLKAEATRFASQETRGFHLQVEEAATPMLFEDPHKPLRDDVRLLGTLLGETLRRQEGDALFERVERVRGLAKRARRGDAEASRRAFDQLAGELADMPVEAALPIARAFAHFLNLANVAE